MKLLPYYFQSIRDSFDASERNGGKATEAFYRLGDATIRLRFLSADLARAFTPAFAHVAVPPTKTPDLTVGLWAGMGGGAEPPPPAALDGSWSHHFLSDGRFDTACWNTPNRVMALDGKTSTAYFWIEDVARLDWWDPPAPLRLLLSWWAPRRGLQVLHAAAVGTPEGGVLLGGKGGAGKSWTALACLGSNLSYAGDDYCLVSGGVAPRAFSLYSSAKLKTRADLRRFPHLEPAVSNMDRLEKEKVVMFLGEKFSGHIVPSFPIKAILLPRVGERKDMSFEKADRRIAIGEIFSSTARQRIGTQPMDFFAFYRLVSGLPCFHFNLGPDLSEIPGAISSLLSKVP